MPSFDFVPGQARARQGVARIETIFTSSLQPRTVFDESALEELKASVRSRGIIEPLIVRPLEHGWELVCGERRYRAALAVGLCEVPVRVLELDDDDAHLMALHENLHRDSLGPIDEARAYRRIMESGRVRSQRALARLLNVGQSRVSQRLALLSMPHEVIAAMACNGQSRPWLTERHAREIRRLRELDDQAALARRVVAEALTVEQTRALVRAGARPANVESPGNIRMGASSFQPTYVENRVKSLLHYWLSIWECRNGDVCDFKEILDPGGFSIDLLGAAPATTLDAISTYRSAGVSQFSQSSHALEDVRITGSDKEYHLNMRVAWRGVSVSGDVASVHTVHDWTIKDYGERFPRIRQMRVSPA